MRLPTISHQQNRTEDAREFHETVYLAYVASQLRKEFVTEDRVFTPCARRYVSAMAKLISDARHRFWLTRGFRLRFKQASDGSGFYVWLEPKETAQEVAA